MTPRQYHAYAAGWNKRMRAQAGVEVDDSPAPMTAAEVEAARKSWADDAQMRRDKYGLD